MVDKRALVEVWVEPVVVLEGVDKRALVVVLALVSPLLALVNSLRRCYRVGF